MRDVVCSEFAASPLSLNGDGGQILRSKRRVRQEPAVTRALLLDATERLMVLEGYAAVTTRRVASKVGLTGALVHYYYPTTDDLLLAAYRRSVERFDQRIREAAASHRPLHALWNILTDSSHMALGVEFMALANHRKIVRMEIVQHDERIRKFLADALAGIFAAAGLDPKVCPPFVRSHGDRGNVTRICHGGGSWDLIRTLRDEGLCGTIARSGGKDSKASQGDSSSPNTTPSSPAWS